MVHIHPCSSAIPQPLIELRICLGGPSSRPHSFCFFKLDSAQHPQPAEKLLYLSYIVSLVNSLEDSTLVISFSQRSNFLSHFLSHFLNFLSLSFSLDPDEPGLLMTISSAHPARIGRDGHAIKDSRKS